MAELTKTQLRALRRARLGLARVEQAKEEVDEALDSLDGIRGFRSHYARLEKLHDSLRELCSRVTQAMNRPKPLDLTAQAVKEIRSAVPKRARRRGGRS